MNKNRSLMPSYCLYAGDKRALSHSNTQTPHHPSLRMDYPY